MSTLWALTRDGHDDHIAAPSSEAALAACTEVGDRLDLWALGSPMHECEVSRFLECWEPRMTHA